MKFNDAYACINRETILFVFAQIHFAESWLRSLFNRTFKGPFTLVQGLHVYVYIFKHFIMQEQSICAINQQTLIINISTLIVLCNSCSIVVSSWFTENPPPKNKCFSASYPKICKRPLDYKVFKTFTCTRSCYFILQEHSFIKQFGAVRCLVLPLIM